MNNILFSTLYNISQIIFLILPALGTINQGYPAYLGNGVLENFIYSLISVGILLLNQHIQGKEVEVRNMICPRPPGIGIDDSTQ